MNAKRRDPSLELHNSADFGLNLLLQALENTTANNEGNFQLRSSPEKPQEKPSTEEMPAEVVEEEEDHDAAEAVEAELQVVEEPPREVVSWEMTHVAAKAPDNGSLLQPIAKPNNT